MTTSRIVSAVDLMAMQFPDPRWAVPGYVPEGLSVMAGKPKIGKSWLAFGFGLAVAFGGQALGDVKVEQGEVLYLALEDSGRRLQSRLSILLAGSPPPSGLYLARDWPRGDEGVEEVAEWLATHEQARLVIIDTLARFRSRRKGNGSRGYDDDTEDLVPLHKLANTERAAIMLLHHNRKLQAEDWIDELSGTLGIAGTADALLGLFRARGVRGAELKVTGRDVEERESRLRFEPLLGLWVVDPDAPTLPKERQEIVDELKQAGTILTTAELCRRLDRSNEATRSLLKRMADDGQVVEERRGWSLDTEHVGSVGNVGNPIQGQRVGVGDVGSVGNVGNPTIPTYTTSSDLFHPWSSDKIGGSQRGRS